MSDLRSRHTASALDVRVVRGELGLDAEVLAQILGVALSTVYRWESKPDAPIDLGSRRLLCLLRDVPERKRGRLGRALDNEVRTRGGLSALRLLLNEALP